MSEPLAPGQPGQPITAVTDTAMIAAAAALWGQPTDQSAEFYANIALAAALPELRRAVLGEAADRLAANDVADTYGGRYIHGFTQGYKCAIDDLREMRDTDG